MTTAVDSSVLFDLLSNAASNAGTALEQWANRGELIVCEVVYGELAAAIEAGQGMAGFLSSTGLKLVNSSTEALSLAGSAWKEYMNRRPSALTCARCGALNQVWCSSCGEPVRARQHLMPDFIIGAHATVQAERLLTRDRGFHGSQFKDLEVVGY